MNHKFYVYILFDWQGIPFYVGKGYGERWLSHERSTDSKNMLKNEIIEQTWTMLGEVPKIKFAESISENEAFDLEVVLIATIGRRDRALGPLVNMTDGGDGVSGHRHSDIMKKYFSQLSLDSWQDPAIRTARIEGTKRSWRDNREARITAVRAGFDAMSEEAKAAWKYACSVGSKGKPKSAAHTAKVAMKNRTRGATDEWRAERSDIQTRLWKDPAYRERMLAARDRPKPRWFWITDGLKSRHHPIDADIPIGWRRGKTHKVYLNAAMNVKKPCPGTSP